SRPNMKISAAFRSFLLLFVLSSGGPRYARADVEPPEIRFADARFDPAEVVIEAGTPFPIRVTNASDTPIEFESFELHRERVVPPGATITVYFPALPAGSFKFFDDFHSEVPQGAIVAK